LTLNGFVASLADRGKEWLSDAMRYPAPIVILAGQQSGGTTFRLDPLSSRRLHQEIPNRHPVSSLSVGIDNQRDF
jgi:hypothetical protein